ncbi:MAG: mevalonate kinase [Candidatus Micrarchaeia archaeon]
MEVKAPCVAKLFGEHAVVHGMMAVALGVNIYARASFKKSNTTNLTIKLNDLNQEFDLDINKVIKLSHSYSKKSTIEQYINENKEYGKDILPYCTIVARIFSEFNVIPNGIIEISSEIPKQSGLASSASCYTAFTIALIRELDKKVEDNKCIDMARDGERVSHKNDGAGKIDVSTAYYGGYVSFKKNEFIKHEIKTKLKLLIINTGPKLPTSVTVGRVSKLLADEHESTTKLLEEINNCSIEGLEALSKNKINVVGELMYKNHELLKKLGVSNERLDIAVDISKKHKAHGAKLSGGGGGGVAIAILEEYYESLEKELKNEGFNILHAEISDKGAKELFT